jgi:hypothetical protein
VEEGRGVAEEDPREEEEKNEVPVTCGFLSPILPFF